MYDLIGDIHGHAGPLKRLLQKLGYQQINDAWQHPERNAIFVGDYIDRGPAIRETLQIVKSMTDAGHAIALMGNHEYNALAYNHLKPDGQYLRKHNDVHNFQHEATLQEFKAYPGEWQEYLQWFYTLPLYLENESLRAVHACWDHEHIQWLKNNGIITMTEDFLKASHQNGSEAYEVINDLLKGKEMLLPSGCFFLDKDGHIRRKARYKWWMKNETVSFKDLLFDCPPSVEELMSEGLKAVEYASDAPPVFFGHYWLKDSVPMIQATNVVCLDYSVAKKGQLVAYRWNPGKEISNENFVFTGSDDQLAL